MATDTQVQIERWFDAGRLSLRSVEVQ